MSARGIPFDEFLAGATRFHWCCVDCPRLYVGEFYAARHAVAKGHGVRSREELAGFLGAAEHPFVACNTSEDIRAIVCCFCSLPREEHANAIRVA